MIKSTNKCFEFFIILSVLFVLIPNITQSFDIIADAIDNDMVYADGVLFENVQLPSDEENIGRSIVNLKGVGTITIGNRKNGGFPRLIINGETTISSQRHFIEENHKAWWEGQLQSPTKGQDITNEKIQHHLEEIEIKNSFLMGLNNEIFFFNPSIEVILPVNAPDGQKLFVAYLETDIKKYKLNQSQFCLVKDNLCVLKTNRLNSFVLVKEISQDTCSTLNFPYSKSSNAPDCLISCDTGYELDLHTSTCLASSDSFFEEKISSNLPNTIIENNTSVISNNKVVQKKIINNLSSPIVQTVTPVINTQTQHQNILNRFKRNYKRKTYSNAINKIPKIATNIAPNNNKQLLKSSAKSTNVNTTFSIIKTSLFGEPNNSFSTNVPNKKTHDILLRKVLQKTKQ